MRPGGGLLCSCLCLLACATSPARPPRLTEADYPGLLQPPSALGADVLWQQRVTATWGDGVARSFDAAVQKRGDTLTLIGLSPLGSIGFVVELRDGAIEHRNETADELPFPPRFFLLDVQRVFYPWLSGAGLPRANGEHTAVIGGEQVVEVVADGRLSERRFTRIDGEPEGTITVRYEWGEGSGGAPSRAVLENGWFGYRLSIRTLHETLLPPAGADEGRGGGDPR